MKAKLITLLCCDAATTGPDGKFTLYGLFDVIGCRNVPVRHNQFSIFWKLHSEQPGKVSIRIDRPDGSSLLTSPTMDLSKNPIGKHQGVTTMGGVEFPVSGDYNVVFLFNEVEELGSATLTVQEIGPIQ